MTDSAPTFDVLCSRAVREFLQTVVVIDNEASLASDSSRNTPPTAKATATKKRPSTPGISQGDSNGFVNRATEEPTVKARDEYEPEPHRLELNLVSQAFAEEGLTCGVYLPTETDPAELSDLMKAAAQAILPTDACVLDWQLRKDDSRPAINAIINVLETDKQQGGRLRLILIYTAESLEGASKALEKSLQSLYTITREQPDSGPVIMGDHFRIVFANKPTLGRNPDEDLAVVPWHRLPQRIISEFTILSRGLLRAFALESVAAVRRDMHRILAQFDEELDPVYAGDRATKPDPDDAGRLMVEVLQSELSLSIAASQAEKNVLGAKGCKLWLHARSDRLPADVGTSIKRVGDLENINSMDIGAREIFLTDGFRHVSSRDKQATVSLSFFDSEERWKTHSADYAVLTTIAHHSGKRAGRPPIENPLLQFGTIIGDETQILLCIQPACDTVRLDRKTAFLFLTLVPEDSEFDLILPNDDNVIRYQIPDGHKFKHLREFQTLWFNPQDYEDVIFAQANDTGKHFFTDDHGVQWEWQAQLREMTAVHLAQKAIRAIGRTGANEFEWLRTSAKK